MRPHAPIVALCLIACQTPPQPVETEAFDDQVIVEKDPEPAAPAPDVGVAEAADVASVVEPTGRPETFVAVPELPKNMSFQETALARTVEQVGQGLVFAPILDGPCGIATAIRATADSEGAGYTVDSCSRAVDAAHALTYKRYLSKLGVVDVSTVAIRHDGVVLWTAASDCSDLRQNDAACPTDFISRIPTVFSFVGPLLSYTIATYEASGGGPASSEEQGYVTDVRTGQEAKLSTLIEEDSILNALKQDSYMRRTVDPKKLDATKKLDEVWKLWRTQDFAHFGGYYFTQWNAETGQVVMRIWFLEDAVGMSPNKLKELSVWVVPRPQWRSAFEDAAKGASGFLAK